jgi:hypothetical protein
MLPSGQHDVPQQNAVPMQITLGSHGGGPQAPSLHDWPSGQASPHAPQFFTSLPMFTHVSPQHCQSQFSQLPAAPPAPARAPLPLAPALPPVPIPEVPPFPLPAPPVAVLPPVAVVPPFPPPAPAPPVLAPPVLAPPVLAPPVLAPPVFAPPVLVEPPLADSPASPGEPSADGFELSPHAVQTNVNAATKPHAPILAVHHSRIALQSCAFGQHAARRISRGLECFAFRRRLL